ncbi:MAG TPA: hypothetical protein VE621_08550, partial [Bryobacteraceae bacterium]|nr:hypothetical protein [Bryobacteraceae bacterium]
SLSLISRAADPVQASRLVSPYLAYASQTGRLHVQLDCWNPGDYEEVSGNNGVVYAGPGN